MTMSHSEPHRDRIVRAIALVWGAARELCPHCMSAVSRRALGDTHKAFPSHGQDDSGNQIPCAAAGERMAIVNLSALLIGGVDE
jgi:predicted ATP-dependent serine protease